MNYWWVNHKQTHKKEIDGGYLWSPKKMSNGARSQYYEFMRQVVPGDRVISFANAKISYFGIVTGFPVSAPKPDAFQTIGDNWSHDGWYIPLEWHELKKPFRPKDNIDAIKDLLPKQYAPIQQNGNGNQAAYLTKIDSPLFEKLLTLGGTVDNHESLPDLVDEENLLKEIEDKIAQNILNDKSIEETEAISMVKARKGQGLFRRNVEKLEDKCRVTGLRDKRLLVASHIKPWRLCETGTERLDGANGLLLAPHTDKLFDMGLISFEDIGRILVSPALSKETLNCLGLDKAYSQSVGTFSAEQKSYLAYHREKVFLK